VVKRISCDTTPDGGQYAIKSEKFFGFPERSVIIRSKQANRHAFHILVGIAAQSSTDSTLTMISMTITTQSLPAHAHPARSARPR